jgi:hypothetical protein
VPDWGCPPAPDDFPQSLHFDASALQVKAWLRFKDMVRAGPSVAMGAAGAADEAGELWDEDEIDDNDAASVLSEISRESEHEVVHPILTAPTTPPSTPPRKLDHLHPGSIRSLPLRSKPSPSKHPVSFHVPSLQPSIPAKDRTHSTAQKYLCSFLLTHNAIRCAVSGSKDGVQCAHLVPQATSPVTHSRLEMAVGGRFSCNSRLNYVLRV